MNYPKQGNTFHPGMHLKGSLKAPLADALRKATRGMRNAAKVIAQAADRHERTAKNWLSAETEMSATELVRLIGQFDEVYQVVMAAAGRQEVSLTETQKDALRLLLGEK